MAPDGVSRGRSQQLYANGLSARLLVITSGSGPAARHIKEPEECRVADDPAKTHGFRKLVSAPVARVWGVNGRCVLCL